jgi:hypothetical protein
VSKCKRATPDWLSTDLLRVAPDDPNLLVWFDDLEARRVEVGYPGSFFRVFTYMCSSLVRAISARTA